MDHVNWVLCNFMTAKNGNHQVFFFSINWDFLFLPFFLTCIINMGKIFLWANYEFGIFPNVSPASRVNCIPRTFFYFSHSCILFSLAYLASFVYLASLAYCIVSYLASLVSISVLSLWLYCDNCRCIVLKLLSKLFFLFTF